MSGPIARRPAGLLDLLLTQQQGKNPNELGDMLLPVIDLSPFYMQERLTTATTSLTNAVVGSSATITIPAGESWMMHFLSVRGSFNAVNQRLKVGFRAASIDGGTIIDIGQTEQLDAIGATDGYSGQVQFAPGSIYPAGTRFLASTQVVDLALGANISGSLNALFVRMET